MNDPKQIKEADNFMKAGVSANKKSFFHKPDYVTASSSFSKAGDAYSNLNMFAEAKEAYEQAAIAYDNSGLQGKSGECYVSAAKAALNHNESNEVLRLLQEAKVRFFECDQPLQGIRRMKEMAQRLKQTDPEVAYVLYDTLLDVIENTEKYHWEKDSFVDFAILANDMEKYPETFQVWDRAKKAFLFLKNYDNAAHCVVSAIVIHLKRNDIVAAENLFNEALQQDWFTKTEDFSMIDMLLRGVKNRDGDLIAIAQKNVILSFLKPEISRIIYSFKAPSKAAEKPTPAANVPENSNNENNEKAEEENEEEEEKWLL
ncbi:gamma-soluble NSF attachment protein [Histomonas meleagridis]|uniref:gamma-soluble NSF attachment protein n=1 Tax=Histomonas meleagridis TaxID=135588 RepID=UPI0035593E03|nr:gamma-soluble NSF attachment protein [Histomonas meleagridis]KAH0799627.1 gamma-soluble NSF attachment protein [Histomonas meleagridis]